MTCACFLWGIYGTGCGVALGRYISVRLDRPGLGWYKELLLAITYTALSWIAVGLSF